MHAEPFEYAQADTVSDAIRLLGEIEDSRLLAGGQALIPLLKQRKVAPATLVDISGIDELHGIEHTDTGVQIGALTTHREITNSDMLADSVPVLPAAISKISGGIQVHNVATIGGNIARAHPAYDYAGALLAAEARIHIAGPDGKQIVPITEFFCGACETCLEESQLVTAVEIDNWNNKRYGGYAKKKEPASGGSVIGIATDLLFEAEDNNRVSAARVAANGFQEHAVRITAAEEALTGRLINSEAIELAADAAGGEIDTNAILDNKKASADYREALLGPYVRRSLNKAIGK
ncbi:xanthine dehydrogenase family protein subunit M [Haloquadratum walsbyi]|uniref:Aerobic-type carbon monoxide dehydrogenase, middle subunit CoxM/CutM-like protein n=1 Tax=Haloquadratum walsbyi J07HQW2 TaxID=1238425 RepID=U1PTN0_9EURY|nr:FAD binding domain-containing protein [Haloquadratum walsbyi]ERG97162.1 MAG: Aerobic-type carbon monoxide dehydrogenase, middle subunit CoxM/CutM-like protein [Haloquadratum walsbyi J07HQW2]